MKKVVLSPKRIWANKKLRYVLLGVIVVAIGAAMAYNAMQGRAVAASTAAMRQISEEFYEDGVVKAESRGVVSADISAKVLSVSAKEGQRVQAGDLLLTLDAADLSAQRELLAAERNSVLAMFTQSREQVEQQIAALEAQRAGYATSDLSGAYAGQVALLDESMNSDVKNSVAWSFEQMIDDAEDSANTDHTDTTSQSQVSAAKAQALSIKNQIAQYTVQRDAQVAELRKLLPDPAVQIEIDALLDSTVNPILVSYTDMLADANALVSKLKLQAASGGEAIDSAAQSEFDALKQQYDQFLYNTQAQVLALTAQQEQAAAAYGGASKARGQIGKQISLLKQSLSDDAGTASYYEAQIARLDVSIKDIDRRIALTEVKAPVAGVVAAISAEAGQYVMAGGVLTQVVDTGEFAVECMLLTEDLGGIQAGMQASIVWERREGDVEYPCTVQEISAIAVQSVSAVGLSEQRVKITLKPEFAGEVMPNDGYQVRVRFTLRSETAVIIPQTAVFQSELGDSVYCIRDGRAVLAPVTLSIGSGGEVAVTSGVQAGDVVVIDPNGVKEGERLTAQ